MERSFGSRIGLVVLTAGAMVGAYYMHFLFLIEHCYLGDDAGVEPARASLQGRICGDPDVPLNFILLGFESGAILTVILFVMSWRSASSWAGKLASFLVPPLVMGFTWGALSFPPDTCSESAKANELTASCTTGSR